MVDGERWREWWRVMVLVSPDNHGGGGQWWMRGGGRWLSRKKTKAQREE